MRSSKSIWNNDENDEFEVLEKVMDNLFVFFEKMSKYGYEDREEQQNMAMDIVEAMENEQDIIIEAGVGIGKSYAYLVPLMLYYKIKQEPFIISTSTIALQEQLEKDLNTLNKIMELKVPIIIAKGKTHYLCKKRINDREILEKIKENPLKNDRAKFDSISDRLWNKINVDKCRFNKCDLYKDCFFIKLRDKTKNCKGAVICNHDLLFENQKRKAEGRRTLLPDANIIVIDEAHNIEEKGRNSFKKEISYNIGKQILDKALNFLIINPEYYEEKYFKIAEDNLNKVFNMLEIQVKKQIDEAIRLKKIVNREELEICKVDINLELEQASIKLYDALKRINYSIQINDNDYISEDNISNQVEDVISIFKALSEKGINNIFWIENKKRIVLNTCSKTINKEIKSVIFDDRVTRKILTSATLNTSKPEEKNYSYYIKNIGIDENDSKIYLSTPKISPFDYNNNMLFYYANDIAHPQREHEKYIKDITNRIIELIKITNGKTLILFTAKSDMNIVFNNLKEQDLEYNILVQQDGSSQKAIKEQFENNINSVLLSTGTFWEGIDIKGKALSNVIIVRLPFPVITPIIQYKCSLEKDKVEGVLVPEMKIKLKQGIGRLIRSDKDTGIICVLDSRVEKYKKRVLECVPTKNVTNRIEDVKKFVKKKNIDC